MGREDATLEKGAFTSKLGDSDDDEHQRFHLFYTR